jgi:hypothetical protein
MSIDYNTIGKGIILNDITKKLIKNAETIIKPTGKETKELISNHKFVSTEFLKNLKFNLYDRIETGCVKCGNNLWIGTFIRECFEVLFSKYNCKRGVEVTPKGKKNFNDCFVYVTYECDVDNPILNEVPAKYDFVTDVEKNVKIIRSIRSRYTKLKFKFNLQNKNVTCDWEQITEKSYDNKWNETY